MILTRAILGTAAALVPFALFLATLTAFIGSAS